MEFDFYCPQVRPFHHTTAGFLREDREFKQKLVLQKHEAATYLSLLAGFVSVSAKTTNSPSDLDYAVKNPRKDVIFQTFVSLAIKNPIVSLSQVRVSGIKAG